MFAILLFKIANNGQKLGIVQQKDGKRMQIQIQGTNEVVEYDPANKLTPQNALDKFDQDKAIVGQSPTLETLMRLSFYMDFAISTKNLALITKMHNRITNYFLEVCSS